MAAPLAFYFDFISPYGYFASLRIEELAARHGRRVDWRPMLLGVAVLKVMGLKPLMETPLKGEYVRRDVLRYARRHGLPLRRDLNASVGNPLPPARAFYWVKQQHPHLEAAMAHALFHAFWAEGRDLSTPQQVGAIELPGGLDGEVLAEATASEEAAALLRTAVASALKGGIFGSPMVMADGEPFWGVDRFADLDLWLSEGGW
jgi:2-hydroxychromene-2-carboxylate isomerase